MMSVAQRIGLDIGAAPNAEARIRAAADAGARLVRLGFPLGDRSYADEAFLAEARRTVDLARGARLRVLGVLDGRLTVAPDGAGTLTDEGPSALAAAWTDEMAGNAGRLVGALAGAVSAWEIEPTPNRVIENERRIAPARWAAILDAVGTRVRAEDPEASIVAGGLVSDDRVDGVSYLGQAAEAGGWSSGDLPFDAIGIVLRIAPEGGGSESVVKSLISERAQRLWNSAVAQLGEDRIDGLWVTSVAWDAVKAGESAQARNLWTACDTLTADPLIRSVIWSGLVDEGSASGLFASADLSPDARRPAWTAFNDFALYAAQIAVAPHLDFDPLEMETDGEPDGPSDREPEVTRDADAGEPELVGEPEVVFDRDRDDADLDVTIEPDHDIDPDVAIEAGLDGQPDIAIDHGLDFQPDMAIEPEVDGESEPALEPEIFPVHVEEEEPEPADVAGPADTEWPSDVADPADVESPAEPAVRRIAFHVPRIAELLEAEGLDAEALERALDAVAARYGSRDWLPAGEYEIDVADRPGDQPPDDIAAPSDRPTNQDVLSAFYRAGGGTWSLLAKAGLDLADLVTARSAAYEGPAIAALDRLDPAEANAITRELDGGRGTA